MANVSYGDSYASLAYTITEQPKVKPLVSMKFDNPLTYDVASKFQYEIKREKQIRNYLIPGLLKASCGKLEDGSEVSYLHMRTVPEYEIPVQANQRDIQLSILAGAVTLYNYNADTTEEPSKATHAALKYNENKHSLSLSEPLFLHCVIVEKLFTQGHYFTLKFDQFYRIKFGNGAQVIMVEGQIKNSHKRFLYPVDKGRILDNFVWRDWMTREENAFG